MQQRLQALCDQAEPWIIEARRYLHSVPEPGFKEFKTSAFIAEKLGETSLAVRTGVAGTGVVARLVTDRPGPVVMLRADMDGLPIQEETGLPFASVRDGYSHACGHDCHSAMLLGAARVLDAMRGELSGEVRLVCQPAEEDPGGAMPMIQAGVMDDPCVDYCFGQHVSAGLPAGTIGVKAGNLMASPAFFYITIQGRGGHGAMPHECVDALEVGTQVVGALQRIVSRRADPLEPTVVSVGSFHAGTAENAIAETAEITGTVRTFSKDWADGWKDRLETVVDGVCRAMGASYGLSLSGSYPPVVNDHEAAAIARAAAEKIVPPERVVEPEPAMAGEDMAYYMERAKGAFVFLGTGYDGGYPAHNPRFTVPDTELVRGTALMSQIALDLLAV